MANELTDLELGEWSICIDPANEDSTIEIVKSKSGLAPVFKETDMSDQTVDVTDEGEAEFEQFATEVLEEFNDLSAEEQAEALVSLVAENAELEGAVEDATDVVKSLTESAERLADIEPKFEALKKSAAQAADLIEKMKRDGKGGDAETGLAAEIRKSLGDNATLTPEAEARLSEVEKSLAAQAEKEAIVKARTYGFGKAEDVAGLETRIRKGRTTAADADLFVALVKQAGGLAKASPAFKAIGEDNAPDADVGAIAKMNAAASEIKKSKPHLSSAQAMDEAMQSNPDLYRAYEAERRSGRAA